jgi:hypothetical protein
MKDAVAAVAPDEDADQFEALRHYIERFLQYLVDERFEAGRSWARGLVSKGAPDQFDSLNESENSPGYEVPPELLDLPADQAFLMYAGNYFAARYKIEQSYLYQHAHELLALSQRFLAIAEAKTGSRLLSILNQFSGLQLSLSQIERGCYNSDETLMQRAAEELLQAVDAIIGKEPQLTPFEDRLYRPRLKPRLEAHKIYGQAMLHVARLNTLRWTDRERFRTTFESAIGVLETMRARLGTLGATIMENDLAPQIETLKKFAGLAMRSEQEGELMVKEGRLEIAHYALVRPDLAGPLGKMLSAQASAASQSRFSLEALGAPRLEDDPLSDIWAWEGGESEKPIDSVSWQLATAELMLRNRKTRFAAKLRYFNFGVFALSLETEIDTLSVSAVRHISTLASPITLGETMTWGDRARQFATLEEFAKFVFPVVEAEIRRVLAVEDGKAGSGADGERTTEPVLYHDGLMNRFTALRVDRLALHNRDGLRPLTPREAVDHPAFKALIVPAFEVRVAIDDWIMRRPPPPSANLAPLRYYDEGDAIYAQRHDGVIALLNQANWVRDQAWEGMTVCAAVTNFFCFTNAVFNERVRSLTRNASQWSKLSGKGMKGLNKELARTEEALHAVENFEHDVEKRLDTMESGHFMRFPDLTLLINRLFEELGLPELTVQSRALLAQAREKHQQLRDRLTRAQDALKARASERLSSIAAIIGALVGLAQIQPLLNLSKDLGYEISPTGQLAIYSSLLAIVLILLISGRIRRGS